LWHCLMRASAASASPKPVLYLFAGLAVLLVTYNLFARPDGTNTSLETPSTAYRPVVGLDADDGPTVNRRVVEAVVKDRPTIAAQPPVVSETAAAPVAAGTAAGAGVAQGMSFEDVSAVRARLTGVPASKAHGSLSSQCQLTVDAERRGLLTNLPGLQLSALGAGECGALPPALCAAVRGALGGAAEAAAGAPRLLVTTYAGGAAQAERLRLFADHAAALQLPLVALAMDPTDAAAAAAVKGLCFWAPAPSEPKPAPYSPPQL
jgi:hypothetical protein